MGDTKQNQNSQNNKSKFNDMNLTDDKINQRSNESESSSSSSDKTDDSNNAVNIHKLNSFGKQPNMLEINKNSTPDIKNMIVSTK